jgi:hypothetical protein
MKNELKREIAEYILGEREEITISGNPEQVAVTAEAIQASRALYLVLQQESSPGNLKEALNRKQRAVERWRRVISPEWDL